MQKFSDCRSNERVKVKKLLKSKSVFIASLIIFRLLLDFAFVNFVSVVYEIDAVLSFGFEFELYQYSLSWILYLSALFFVRHRLKNFSDYFFVVVVLDLIAPLTSLYGLSFEKPVFPVLATLLAVYIIYLVVKVNATTKVNIPYFKNSRNIIIYLAWAMIFIMSGWFIASGVLSSLNFDINRVYDFRDVNSKIVDLGLLAYLNVWTYKFFSILLICYATSQETLSVGF